MAQTKNESTQRTGATVIQTIKQNPGAAAMTALGVTWLVINGRSSGSQLPGIDQAKDMVGGVGDQVQDSIGTATDGIGTLVEGAVQGAETVVSGVAHSVTSLASEVEGTITDASTHVKQVPGRLRLMVEENPIRLGLVGIALGSAVALSVPETRRENQMLGGARDSVVGLAQTTAQSTLKKVKQVAEEVGDTVEKGAEIAALPNGKTSS